MFSKLSLTLAVVCTIIVSAFALARSEGKHSAAMEEHPHTMQRDEMQHDEMQHDEAGHDKPLYRWTESSDSGMVNVAIFPKGNKLVFNDFHTWVVELTDHNGEPITDAQIAIDGGMEAHGHGLPSKPEIGAELGGQYLIDGMLFNMSGDWTLALQITTSNENARFNFPVTLSH